MCSGKEQWLAPTSSESICYRPMDRDTLDGFLELHEMSIPKKLLNRMYSRLQAVMEAGEALEDLDLLARNNLAPVKHLLDSQQHLAGRGSADTSMFWYP